MTFNKKYLFYFFITFSAYVAISIGQSWDERYHYELGKITFNYIFSFGKIDKDIIYREYYSPISWALQYFISIIFTSNYKTEVIHIINFSFALTTIYGIKKIAKLLFNNNVGTFSFILILLLPVYFGHMPINSKDTFLAACHVWIFYYLVKYLKHNKINRPFRIKFVISFLLAFATGIQILFIGSLLPILIFFILDAFYFKKFLKKKISIYQFLKDLIIIFFLFYLILIIFWLDAHNNIIKAPVEILFKMFSKNYWTGWPFNNLYGEYFISSVPPAGYILKQIFFKLPEYLIILNLFFFYILIFKNNLFSKKIKNFNYKFFIILILITYPSIILIFIPFPIYDGLRLFMWSIPYIVLPAAIALDHLWANKDNYKKLILFTGILFIYFIYNFITITPYHYTYLNIFTGKKSERYKKFENDYWGTSVEELIKKSNLDKNTFLSINICGVNRQIIKESLEKNNYTNYEFNYINPKFIIMTNRTTMISNKKNKITNCFDMHPGTDLSVVKKNGIVLSTIRRLD